MKAVKEYIRSTDKLFILLCMACSALSVVALTSIAHDSASAQNSLFSNYRLPIVQAGAAALGLLCAVVISTFDYHALAASWPFHVAVSWGHLDAD